MHFRRLCNVSALTKHYVSPVARDVNVTRRTCLRGAGKRRGRCVCGSSFKFENYIEGVEAMLAITRELFEHATDRTSIPLTVLDLEATIYIEHSTYAKISNTVTTNREEGERCMISCNQD